MAREENFEVPFLEEMPACLRELEQTIYTEQKHFPENFHHSAISHKSTLSFDGKHLPPPMLTEEERAEMRQYRRKAMECESIMFEKRRQKHSSLILQVMSVMDRIRIKRGRAENTDDHVMNESERTLLEESSSLKSNSNRNSGMTDIMQQPISSNFQSDFRDHSNERTFNWDGNVPCWGQERIIDSSADSEYFKHHLHSSIFDSQMEYMLHTTESDLTAHQRGMPRKAAVEKNAGHLVLRDFDSRLESENCVQLEGMEFPVNSTLVKDAPVLNRTSSQYSLPSSGMSEVSYSLHKPLSPLHNREDLVSDSLASTSLSITFSESSISTVQSVVEMDPRATAQRQLYMGDATNEHKTYQQPYSPGSVKDPQGNYDTNRKPETQKQNTKKLSKTNVFASSSSSSQDHDQALAHLDKLKQRLQEEKQKQIQILKQQELVRLRVHKREQFSDLDGSKGKFKKRTTPKDVIKRPHSMPFVRQFNYQQLYDQDSGVGSLSSDGSFVHHEKSKTVPYHRPFSSSSSEMYSILERSSENFDAGTIDNITEDESSSDKENNVNTMGARSSRSGVLNQGQDVFQYGLQRRDDRENLQSRRENKDQRISELDLRDKFSSQGQEKFAKVSAYAKGFLTRLLLRTEKVRALIQTVKDTRDFLADISREDSCSFQEKMLKENVEIHLKGARCNLYDVFFTIPIKERMSYIAQSRNMAEEKKAKRAVGSTGSQAKLSAVTLRAIQRRQEGLEQNPSRKCDTSEAKPKFDSQEERKRNKNWNIRVLKPQQSRLSPPLPDKTRSRKHNIRPSTAPGKPLNSRLPKEDSINCPQTTQNTHLNSKKGYRLSLGGGSQPTKRPGRLSLGGNNRQQKVTGPPTSRNSNVQPRGQKKFSLPESSQPRVRGPVGNDEVTQRPRTASDIKRGSRTLAANFAK